MNKKSIPDGTHDASKLIALLRGSMTRRQLAESLGVSTSTVERWESGKVECRQAYVPALRELYYGTTREDGTDFRTIDLFAGIGGIRRGFASAGGHAVFSSEWNEFSTRTYRTNYGFAEDMAGDITKTDADDIPDCDVVLAGFPCRPSLSCVPCRAGRRSAPSGCRPPMRRRRLPRPSSTRSCAAGAPCPRTM